MQTKQRPVPTFAALLALTFLALVPGVAPAAAGENTGGYDPFVIPAARFHAEVKKVALVPIDISGSPETFGAVRNDVETRFAQALAAQGFQVVASAEYRRVWSTLAGRLGGVYDPVTGEPVTEKWKTCFDLVARELARDHAVDAVVMPVLSYGSMDWSSSGFLGLATVMGEQVTMHGKSVRGMGPLAANRIVGSWFGVVVRDLAGAELFDLRYPIQWSRVFSARSWADRPDGEFRDPADVQRAVDFVAAALGGASPTDR